MDGNSGYDFIIIPAITDNSLWSVNNKSMMVVVQTAAGRVVLGGDIQGTASQEINNYENSNFIKKMPADAYSYYYGVKHYIFESGTKYIAYKVSHHGIGSNRNVSAREDIIEVERIFFQNLNANVLALTGCNNGAGIVTKPDNAYYELIYRKAVRYSEFAAKRL